MNNITNISGLEDSDINVLSAVSGCTPKGYRHSGTAALPTRRRASYPSGNYSNEEVLRKIRSKRQKGIIDCRVTWLNNPVQDHPDDAPYYPVSLIAVEESDGTIMSMSLVGDYESEYDQLLSEFMLNLSARKMRPKKILVQNARTFALLAEAMKKPGAAGTPTSARIIRRDAARQNIASATSHSLRAKNSSTSLTSETSGALSAASCAT